MHHSLTRRNLLARGNAAGFFLISGQWVWLTPGEAAAQHFRPQVLSKAQCDALSDLAETLVPGAKAAGFAAYVDLQLQAGEDSLLIGKYLGVDTTMQSGFYRGAADNIINNAKKNIGIGKISAQMASDSLDGWAGPPASYVFFILRADALDVTYGTPEGFEKLGIPYMAQIMPEKAW